MDKALADYEAFLRGLEEVAAYAPPGAARLQTAWLLLRVCGLGKATHLLRTLPPALTQDFADALDTATLEAVERLALLDCLTDDQVGLSYASLRATAGAACAATPRRGALPTWAPGWERCRRCASAVPLAQPAGQRSPLETQSGPLRSGGPSTS